MPTPLTTAVMIDPPAEPSFVERDRSFGAKVIPGDNSVYPLGRPMAKKRSMELVYRPLVRESTWTTISVAEALSTV